MAASVAVKVFDTGSLLANVCKVMKWTAFFCGLCVLLLSSRLSAQAQLPADAEEVARAYLASNEKVFGLRKDEVAALRLLSRTESARFGLTHLYFLQYYKDIPIHNAIVNIHLTASQEVFTHGNRLYPAPELRVRTGATARISELQALLAAAGALGYAVPDPASIRAESTDPAHFVAADLSTEVIAVEPVWQPLPSGELRLSWSLSLAAPAGDHWWQVRIDALTGELLDKNDWVVHCQAGAHPPAGGSATAGETMLPCAHAQHSTAIEDFPYQYRIFAPPLESPVFGAASLELGQPDPLASPLGWHAPLTATAGGLATTLGNNAYVQLDNDGNNSTMGYSPTANTPLGFDFAVLPGNPATYRDASMTNTFYWTNYLHDFIYHYGFDERNGNFQADNFGRGGLGSDYVLVDAQDMSRINGASFSAPPDGQRPRMQLHLWNSGGGLYDSGLDNGVIAHEYAHGISIRLTGSPATSNCLSNAEQMGEGWSDWFAMMMTLEAADEGAQARGIGNYLLGQQASGGGLRPLPYTTDMSINGHTYDYIRQASIPHGVGYVWGLMLWDMTWALMDAHGYDEGYDMAIQLVLEGMKLQSCNPGFVDARNAILAADRVLYGAENQCLLWSSFARRGLGYSASQGSPESVTDGQEAFDLPPDYHILPVATEVVLCKGSQEQLAVVVRSCIGSDRVQLLAKGLPAGLHASFLPATAQLPQDTVYLQLWADAELPSGQYCLTIDAAGVHDFFTESVCIRYFGDDLEAPALQRPAAGAQFVSTSPVFSWQEQAGAARYLLRVAADTAFQQLVFQQDSIEGTTYIAADILAAGQTYYWQVAAYNPCGGQAVSAVWSFTSSCKYVQTQTATTPISAVIPAAVQSALAVAGCVGRVASIEITQLNITHARVGDLRATLTAPNGSTVLLFDRPGRINSGPGCRNSNMQVQFSDEASLPADLLEFRCEPVAPAISGRFQPVQPLSGLQGIDPNGNWVLTVHDMSSGAGGAIEDWQLSIVLSDGVLVYYPDADGDGYGDDHHPQAYSCSGTVGFVTVGGDCDDADAAANPEVIWYRDLDGDGYSDGYTSLQCQRPVGFRSAEELAGSALDCNDEQADIYPGAVELCDGTDNDCNALVDDLLLTATGWTSTNIGGAGIQGNAGSDCVAGEAEIWTVGASRISAAPFDQQHFLSQQLCGDGILSCRVDGMTAAGWAGVSMRDGLHTGARRVSIKTQLGQVIRREIRSVNNGFVSSLNYARPGHSWLRLSREGNTFIGHTSADGIEWVFAFAVSLQLSDCITAGLFVESAQVNAAVTATFSQLVLSSGAPLQPVTGNRLVADTEGGEIDVWPNPGQAQIELLLPASLVGAVQKISIVDMLGRERAAFSPDPAARLSLTLPPLPAGMYQLRFERTEGSPISCTWVCMPTR
jgi:subtilisin-like proprotein convertase family protein